NTGWLATLAGARGYRHPSRWWYYSSRAGGDVLAVPPQPGTLLSQALRHSRLYGAQGNRAARARLPPGPLISGHGARPHRYGTDYAPVSELHEDCQSMTAEIGSPCSIAVVIVSFNSARVISECLASLRRQCPPVGLSTVVVDNGSRDGTKELVRREFPEVRLIGGPRNWGVSYGTKIRLSAPRVPGGGRDLS